jgi:hypothetical protein
MKTSVSTQKIALARSNRLGASFEAKHGTGYCSDGTLGDVSSTRSYSSKSLNVCVDQTRSIPEVKMTVYTGPVNLFGTVLQNLPE